MSNAIAHDHILMSANEMDKMPPSDLSTIDKVGGTLKEMALFVEAAKNNLPDHQEAIIEVNLNMKFIIRNRNVSN